MLKAQDLIDALIAGGHPGECWDGSEAPCLWVINLRHNGRWGLPGLPELRCVLDGLPDLRWSSGHVFSEIEYNTAITLIHRTQGGLNGVRMSHYNSVTCGGIVAPGPREVLYLLGLSFNQQ